MCVYLTAKFQVSSIIPTSFRQGVILPPSPTSKRTPKKPTQFRIKGLNISRVNVWLYYCNDYTASHKRTIMKIVYWKKSSLEASSYMTWSGEGPQFIISFFTWIIYMIIECLWSVSIPTKFFTNIFNQRFSYLNFLA